jgi:hypothetical protein
MATDTKPSKALGLEAVERTRALIRAVSVGILGGRRRADRSFAGRFG